VTLGHVRLAILDLTVAADQPMVSADGQVVLVFNGEIYNFRELRAELIASGLVFKGTGDTEAVLAGYLRWGEGVLSKLRGMFAFALWDGRSRTVLLVRDRLGIKPLFYGFDRTTLRFGSEIKAVLAQLSVIEPRREAIGEFLTWLYVPAPNTFFRGVQELPPAHLLRWRPGQSAAPPERYWSPPSAGGAVDFREAAEGLRRILDETVKVHLESDVPLGAFLSGGIDSSSIVALMAKHSSSPVRTFCMTFGEGLYDERAYARSVAERYGARHEEIPVTPHIAELLPRMVRHFDQPFGNPTALLVYELSRLTRERVKVALAGDGGDEVLLGYPRYAGLALARYYGATPLWVRTGIARAADLAIRDSARGMHSLRRAREFLTSAPFPLAKAYASWVAYVGADELRELLGDGAPTEPWAPLIARIAEGPPDDPPAAAARADLETFLPSNVLAYSDRMSMAHGLEVRVPFCDHVLVEYCAALPSSVRMRRGRFKALMKEAVSDLLPPAVKQRRKLGFNPPMAKWLREDLRDLAAEYLSPRVLQRRGIFQPRAVERLLAEHKSGRRDRSLQVWSLIVLEEWQRTYLDQRFAGREESRKWA
jgi:asparagine synthase (glutamine-hydrolysing)